MHVLAGGFDEEMKPGNGVFAPFWQAKFESSSKILTELFLPLPEQL